MRLFIKLAVIVASMNYGSSGFIRAINDQYAIDEISKTPRTTASSDLKTLLAKGFEIYAEDNGTKKLIGDSFKSNFKITVHGKDYEYQIPEKLVQQIFTSLAEIEISRRSIFFRRKSELTKKDRDAQKDKGGKEVNFSYSQAIQAKGFEVYVKDNGKEELRGNVYTQNFDVTVNGKKYEYQISEELAKKILETQEGVETIIRPAIFIKPIDCVQRLHDKGIIPYKRNASTIKISTAIQDKKIQFEKNGKQYSIDESGAKKIMDSQNTGPFRLFSDDGKEYILLMRHLGSIYDLNDLYHRKYVIDRAVEVQQDAQRNRLAFYKTGDPVKVFIYSKSSARNEVFVSEINEERAYWIDRLINKGTDNSHLKLPCVSRYGKGYLDIFCNDSERENIYFYANFDASPHPEPDLIDLSTTQVVGTEADLEKVHNLLQEQAIFFAETKVDGGAVVIKMRTGEIYKINAAQARQITDSLSYNANFQLSAETGTAKLLIQTWPSNKLINLQSFPNGFIGEIEKIPRLVGQNDYDFAIISKPDGTKYIQTYFYDGGIDITTRTKRAALTVFGQDTGTREVLIELTETVAFKLCNLYHSGIYDGSLTDESKNGYFELYGTDAQNQRYKVYVRFDNSDNGKLKITGVQRNM